MVSQNVSRKADEIGLIACFCIASAFVIMRTGARWYKLRKLPFEMEDNLIYLALVAFAITTALYLATIPIYFDVIAIQAKQKAPYPGLPDDLHRMLKEFFVVQFFFWLTLWAVKWSLLAMFKRLTDGLPLYNKVWWTVLVFSILTFIGACISNFTSCSSMDAWFSGQCNTERDARAKEISLWFSLGGDLATDLLIMAVPMRVLWNLKISLVEKISIGFIFAVGIVTMITAIIRSVSLESSVNGGQVSTTWLMLWAAIEGSVAIIVGCLPSFAVFIRGRVSASRVRYADNSKTPSSRSRKSHNRLGEGRGTPRSHGVEDDPESPGWQLRDTASDKSLVEGGGIVVTQSWSQRWQTADGRGGRQQQQRQEEARDPSFEMDAMPRAM